MKDLNASQIGTGMLFHVSGLTSFTSSSMAGNGAFGPLESPGFNSSVLLVCFSAILVSASNYSRFFCDEVLDMLIKPSRFEVWLKEDLEAIYRITSSLDKLYFLTADTGLFFLLAAAGPVAARSGCLWPVRSLKLLFKPGVLASSFFSSSSSLLSPSS